MVKFGIIIMSAFAALWFAWGLSAIHPMPALMLAIPLALSGMIIAVASQISIQVQPAERQATGEIVGWAAAIEGVAILIANNTLLWLGFQEYGVCATAAIVGLHFLPLAYLMKISSYYVSGVAFIGLALAGCVVENPNDRLFTVGIGAAMLLWGTCLKAFGRSDARSAVSA